MNRKTQIIILAVIIMAAAVGFLLGNKSSNNSIPPAVTAPMTATVSINEDGFSPATLKIKAGTTVIWTNSDSNPHRIAANPYPSHSSMPEFDSKTNIDSNSVYRFSFNKAGTYGYHDELHPQTNGTIIVE